MKNLGRGAATCAAWLACCITGVAGAASGPPLQYPAPLVELGEQLQPDEAVNAAALIAELESQIRRRYKRGEVLRDAHSKGHGCVTATFKVDHHPRPDVAHGVFQPGAEYRALIRFSNGNPKAQADKVRDGRGMAIKLYDIDGPRLYAEPGREREHDFVLLSLPRFFMNEVKDYLEMFRIYGMEEGIRQTAAFGLFFATRPHEALALNEVHRQEVADLLDIPYFSTLPYRLGSGRQAVKYLARPCTVRNTPMPKDPGPDFLSERLAGSLEAGSACMDFLVQPRGNAELSVEDVITEWTEDKAPFVHVAQITIDRQKFNPRDENCETESYNPWRVLPEHRPLGAISRVRGVVYQALRGYRQALNTRGYETVKQGWDDRARDTFYHLPQGSPIIPYDWFLALEQADGPAPFAERRHLESFGLIYWDPPDPELNPDGLPIGLTRDVDMRREPHLGMNCGACHVDRIEIYDRQQKRLRSVLIDGGGSHFDFWSFVTGLRAALRATLQDQAKLERFARAVLGPRAPAEKPALEQRLATVAQQHDAWAHRNRTSTRPGPGRVDALGVILNQVTAHMLGPERLSEAVNAPVSFPFLWDAPYLDCVQYNGSVPNAGPGAIGRNVGQVLGVFGQATVVPPTLLTGYPNSVRVRQLLALEEVVETVRSPRWEELVDLGLLPALDTEAIARGRVVYGAKCQHCHGLIGDWPREKALIPVRRIPVGVIGTDADTTTNFLRREVATGPLAKKNLHYVIGTGEALTDPAPARDVMSHVIAGVIVNDSWPLRGVLLGLAGARVSKAVNDGWRTLKGWFGATAPPEDAATAQDRADAEARPDLDDKARALNAALEGGMRQDGPDKDDKQDCTDDPQTPYYRARPLNGIWATAPYLHNGSVATLAELLELEPRREKFYVGSREFDPERVGFVSDRPAPGTMLFDTTIRGNRNTGHHKAEGLTREQKLALLEYLKSL